MLASGPMRARNSAISSTAPGVLKVSSMQAKPASTRAVDGEARFLNGAKAQHRHHALRRKTRAHFLCT